jgi:N-acetylglucosamine-6-phosphate deacetylase
MDQALRNTVKASGLSVERASAAASAVPARALGLEHELGAIAPGMCADLVVLDDDLQVIGVMGAGLWCELETA